MRRVSPLSHVLACAVLLSSFFIAAHAYRVAIIGAGIGGGSAAYYTTKFAADAKISGVEIDAFESRDYIGGRLKSTVIDGVRVELGGDAWANPNLYMQEIARDLKLPIDALTSKVDDAELAAGMSSLKAVTSRLRERFGDMIGVWKGGDEWINIEAIALEHVPSDARAAVRLAEFFVRLRLNYFERDHLRARRGAFDSVADFLSAGHLDEYTLQSTRDYFAAAGVSEATVDDLFVPLNRVIYDQSAEMHAFGTLVSLTSVTSAHSCSDGNDAVVKALFAAANASVHLSTTVQSVSRTADGKRYSVLSAAATGERASAEYDAVILAAPFEHANVAFDDDVPAVAPRPFVHWYVTMVSADGVDPAWFGKPSSWRAPDAIFTTDGSNAPFNVVQLRVDGTETQSGRKIYKLFSNDDVSALVPSLFLNGTVAAVQHWPYTFPHLRPMPQRGAELQPIVLGDKGLLYLNTMESIASAMEVSVTAGRNAALHVAELLAGRASESD